MSICKRYWFGYFSAGMVVMLYASVTQAVTIDFVTIGDPGNTNDDTGYGGVAYTYRISKYEVTAGQYCEFLNAVASAHDPHGLYNSGMDSYHGCEIRRIGNEGSYSYVVDHDGDGHTDGDWVNRPVNYVGFWDACRFANWLHNGQGNGDTETGAYTLTAEGITNNTVTRNADATFCIPTQQEWYKAAYYDGEEDLYYDYPTGSDTVPSNDLVNPDPGNNATFVQDSGHTIGGPYFRTEVGAHENSNSPYGTFDQGGNVAEWSETAYLTYRRGWGGAWGQTADYMHVSDQSPHHATPDWDSFYWGFRIALVPEPSTAVLGIIGVLCILLYRKKTEEQLV